MKKKKKKEKSQNSISNSNSIALEKEIVVLVINQEIFYLTINHIFFFFFSDWKIFDGRNLSGRVISGLFTSIRDKGKTSRRIDVLLFSYKYM